MVALTRLSFWRWLGVEVPRFDQARVSISADGEYWTTVWVNPDEVTDSEWTLVELDISDVADGEETVYLRWTMGETDLTAHYCGWNIDDVEVRAFDLVAPAIDKPVAELRLNPSWPNPFRDETTMVFMLPSDGMVTVSIYDVAGHLLMTLPASRGFAGPNLRAWDGTDADGNDVPSGIYFVRVTAGGESATGKVVLVR